MYAKNIALLASVVSCLMSCTTRPDPDLARPTLAIPPPEVSIELPLEQLPPREPGIAQACLLSTTKSCLELDARPFEPCLAGAANCREKGEGGITLLEASKTPVVDYPAPQRAEAPGE